MGHVHARGDSTASVPNVEVTLEPGGHLTRSDSTGRFVIRDVAAGEHILRLRRLGFEPASQRLLITAGTTRAFDVGLRTTAEPMATITILGREVNYPARLQEPYVRASRGTGKYFMREQIDSLFPQDVQSLLMRVPGVHVSGRGDVEFARCREISANQRIQVYVDGTRWTDYNRLGQIGTDVKDALRGIVPSSIQLMEIYAGASKIPGEYLDDACAVILIWKR